LRGLGRSKARPKPTALIDTHILISGLIFLKGNEHKIEEDDMDQEKPHSLHLYQSPNTQRTRIPKPIIATEMLRYQSVR